MSDPDRPLLMRVARRVASGSLWLMLVGPSIVLVYAWVEVLNNPGISLVDGYWIGREPWITLGVTVSLVGAIAGLLGGSVTIAVEGGWWRRFLIVPVVVGAVLWWSIALGVLPFPDYQAPDPVALAYTLPSTVGLLVLMPAALLAAISITPRRAPPPSIGLRPVAPLSGTALSPRRVPAPWEEDAED